MLSKITASGERCFVEASLSIEHPLRTPPPDKPWARPTRTRVRTVHSAILRLAGVLHGHNLLRAPHKQLQRPCKIWSLVRRITSEVQTPKSPMPGHRGLFSRSRPNRDSPISRDPGRIGIGAKSRIFSRSRPNRDRENPGYFPGQIGTGRDRDSGISGSGSA